MQPEGEKRGPSGGIHDRMHEEIGRIERHEAPERRNRGIVYNLRAHPRITLVLFAVVGFLVWRVMDEAVQTDREMIRETILDLAAGLDKGGEEGQALVLDSLSKDFQMDGFGYATIEAALPQWMVVESLWVGKPQVGDIQITEDKATVARVYIGAGVGDDRGTSSWQVKLQKEADGKWRIVGGDLTHLLNQPTNRSAGSIFGTYSRALGSGAY